VVGFVALLSLEDECARLVLRPYYADHHAAISGQVVAFNGNYAGLGGRHLEDVVIRQARARQWQAGRRDVGYQLADPAESHHRTARRGRVGQFRLMICALA